MWIGAVAMLCVAVVAAALAWVIHMPGRSFSGPLPPLSEDELLTRARLKAHVRALAAEEHNVWRPLALAAVEHYLEAQLTQIGGPPRRQPFDSPYGPISNLEITLGNAHSRRVVVVGAHYDSVQGAPGADDNASGVAAALELARVINTAPGGWPASAPALKFAFFVNEEEPFFRTAHMGSLVYATDARERGWEVQAMFSLETLGYYRDDPGSQRYPWPFAYFYPDRGNFLAFVGDLRSRDLVRRSIAAFRSVARFPSEGVAAPRAVPGVEWSDHWAFWEQGWPAVMITDTAFNRNPNYHSSTDTPDTLDYDRLARVVHGLSGMMRSWLVR